LCRRRYRSQCRSRRTNAGVNDPGVLPCRWPQTPPTGSFTPALVVSLVVVMRAQHVPNERAARVHVSMCEFVWRKQCVIWLPIGSARDSIFPGRTSQLAS
jgi:hypothetical protein